MNPVESMAQTIIWVLLCGAGVVAVTIILVLLVMQAIQWGRQLRRLWTRHGSVPALWRAFLAYTAT